MKSKVKLLLVVLVIALIGVSVAMLTACFETAQPTLTLNPTSVSISDTNLSATVQVQGTATGNITLDTSSLPSNIQATLNANNISVSATRPSLENASIDDSFVVVVSRGTLSVNLTISANLTTTHSADECCDDDYVCDYYYCDCLDCDYAVCECEETNGGQPSDDCCDYVNCECANCVADTCDCENDNGGQVGDSYAVNIASPTTGVTIDSVAVYAPNNVEVTSGDLIAYQTRLTVFWALDANFVGYLYLGNNRLTQGIFENNRWSATVYVNGQITIGVRAFAASAVYLNTLENIDGFAVSFLNHQDSAVAVTDGMLVAVGTTLNISVVANSNYTGFWYVGTVRQALATNPLAPSAANTFVVTTSAVTLNAQGYYIDMLNRAVELRSGLATGFGFNLHALSNTLNGDLSVDRVLTRVNESSISLFDASHLVSFGGTGTGEMQVLVFNSTTARNNHTLGGTQQVVGTRYVVQGTPDGQWLMRTFIAAGAPERLGTMDGNTLNLTGENLTLYNDLRTLLEYHYFLPTNISRQYQSPFMLTINVSLSATATHGGTNGVTGGTFNIRMLAVSENSHVWANAIVAHGGLYFTPAFEPVANLVLGGGSATQTLALRNVVRGFMITEEPTVVLRPTFTAAQRELLDDLALALNNSSLTTGTTTASQFRYFTRIVPTFGNIHGSGNVTLVAFSDLAGAQSFMANPVATNGNAWTPLVTPRLIACTASNIYIVTGSTTTLSLVHALLILREEGILVPSNLIPQSELVFNLDDPRIEFFRIVDGYTPYFGQSIRVEWAVADGYTAFLEVNGSIVDNASGPTNTALIENLGAVVNIKLQIEDYGVQLEMFDVSILQANGGTVGTDGTLGTGTTTGLSANDTPTGGNSNNRFSVTNTTTATATEVRANLTSGTTSHTLQEGTQITFTFVPRWNPLATNNDQFAIFLYVNNIRTYRSTPTGVDSFYSVSFTVNGEATLQLRGYNMRRVGLNTTEGSDSQVSNIAIESVCYVDGSTILRTPLAGNEYAWFMHNSLLTVTFDIESGYRGLVSTTTFANTTGAGTLMWYNTFRPGTNAGSRFFVRARCSAMVNESEALRVDPLFRPVLDGGAGITITARTAGDFNNTDFVTLVPSTTLAGSAVFNTNVAATTNFRVYRSLALATASTAGTRVIQRIFDTETDEYIDVQTRIRVTGTAAQIQYYTTLFRYGVPGQVATGTVAGHANLAPMQNIASLYAALRLHLESHNFTFAARPNFGIFGTAPNLFSHALGLAINATGVSGNTGATLTVAIFACENWASAMAGTSHITTLSRSVGNVAWHTNTDIAAFDDGIGRLSQIMYAFLNYYLFDDGEPLDARDPLSAAQQQSMAELIAHLGTFNQTNATGATLAPFWAVTSNARHYFHHISINTGLGTAAANIVNVTMFECEDMAEWFYGTNLGNTFAAGLGSRYHYGNFVIWGNAARIDLVLAEMAYLGLIDRDNG